jgi:hypothetical protein
MQVVETVKWNRSRGLAWPKTCRFMSGLGNNPAKTNWVSFLAGSGTKPNQTMGQQLDLWRGTRTRS